MRSSAGLRNLAGIKSILLHSLELLSLFGLSLEDLLLLLLTLLRHHGGVALERFIQLLLLGGRTYERHVQHLSFTLLQPLSLNLRIWLARLHRLSTGDVLSGLVDFELSGVDHDRHFHL